MASISKKGWRHADHRCPLRAHIRCQDAFSPRIHHCVRPPQRNACKRCCFASWSDVGRLPSLSRGNDAESRWKTQLRLSTNVLALIKQATNTFNSSGKKGERWVESNFCATLLVVLVFATQVDERWKWRIVASGYVFLTVSNLF